MSWERSWYFFLYSTSSLSGKRFANIYPRFADCLFAFWSVLYEGQMFQVLMKFNLLFLLLCMCFCVWRLRNHCLSQFREGLLMFSSKGFIVSACVCRWMSYLERVWGYTMWGRGSTLVLLHVVISLSMFVHIDSFPQ